jgi:TRAP-type C4-dicarboxylate transport system permease large subunit
VILVVIIFIASKMSGSRVSNIADTAKMGTLKMIDTAFKAQLQAGKLLPIPDGAVTIKIQDQIL